MMSKHGREEIAMEGEVNWGELNRDIVEHLCSVCPLEYIAIFRLVSKEWSEAALKAWRAKARLTVVDYNQNKPRKVYFETLLNLPDLISYVEDPNDSLKLSPAAVGYRYRHYKLESWYLTDKNANMEKFWNHLGSSISHLELCNLRVAEMNTVLEILYYKVPNLHTLILEKVFVKHSGTSEGTPEVVRTSPHGNLKVLKVRNTLRLPVSWTVFFQSFPNIEALEIVNFKNDRDLSSILSAIWSNRANSPGNVQPLKSLSIIRGDHKHNCVQTAIPAQMRNGQDLELCLEECPLEEVTLKLGCRTTRLAVYDILQMFSQTATLKRLNFHIDYKSNRLKVFPYCRKFPYLEELYLYQWCTPIVSINELLEHMPNLKVLKLSGLRSLFKGNNKCDTLMQDIGDESSVRVYSSLNDLSIKIDRLSPTSFKALSLIAPNLTKLEMKLDDLIFGMLCENYENLVELRLHGKGLTDKGILGCNDEPGPSSVVMKRIHNLTDLKLLRVFVMDDSNHPLTNESVFHGFLKVKSLFTLQMSLPETQISPVARRALEEGIPNLVVIKEQKKNYNKYAGP